MSDSLQPHGLQHTRPPCSSPTPGAYSNSCPLSRRCHPTISSSVVPFSSCLQSFPASGSFPVSWLFALGGQSSGASASASVLPMNIQHLFPLGLTGLISSQSKGLSEVFSNTTVWKHHFFSTQPSLWSNSHIHTWLLEKPWLWLYGPFVGKMMSLLFNMLSRFIIAFLPWSKCLLISWLQSLSAVILEPKKIKSFIVSTISPSVCHVRLESMILVFWMLNLSQIDGSSHKVANQEHLNILPSVTDFRQISSLWQKAKKN